MMTPADFQRIALSLEGVEEYSHAGFPGFRVEGRKFASLASQAEGFGNLQLTLEQQAAFVDQCEEPRVERNFNSKRRVRPLEVSPLIQVAPKRKLRALRSDARATLVGWQLRSTCPPKRP
jgi:hypothetical protein